MPLLYTLNHIDVHLQLFIKYFPKIIDVCINIDKIKTFNLYVSFLQKV